MPATSATRAESWPLVSASPGAPGGMATAASTTMLQVLIAEGKAAEAERALAALGNQLGPGRTRPTGQKGRHGVGADAASSRAPRT